MAVFRIPLLLRQQPIVVPPDNTLVEGIIPYGDIVNRWSSIVGTWGQDAPGLQYSGEPQVDAIPAYRASLTSDGYIINYFPPNTFLDTLDQYDLGGTAQGNGQVPLDILIKPKGGSPFLLNQFLGQSYDTYNPQPLPSRVEVEWAKQKSYGSLATWPSQLRPVGLYSPAQYALLAADPVRHPQKIGGLFGICFDWYQFDSEEEQQLVLDFAGGRDYIECYNVKLDDALIHLAPSYNANRSVMMDVWNAANKFYIPAFNNGFRSQRESYTTNGTLDVDAWHNSPCAKGANKLDLESWREHGEFILAGSC